jgi:RNA polymerase sigma-70 factor (sigma-E family)
MDDDDADAAYLEYVGGRATALRRVAFLLCGDEHRADDLVQETITKLYARWARVRRADNVDGYVHTMLLRVFFDEQRRGWWRVRLSATPPEIATSPAGLEYRTMLRTALDRVPPRQRAVLVLRFLCDLPVGEVARILGCSDGTVKSQTTHGLKAMRKALGEPEPGALRQRMEERA